MNLAALLLSSADSRPESISVIEGERHVTALELRGLASNFGGALSAAGVGIGDRVAIASGNDLAFIVTYLGALWIGAIAVPLNPHSPSLAVAEELEHVGAKILVCGRAGSIHLGMVGAVSFDALMESAQSVALDSSGLVEREDSDVAVLLYTSGTAGAQRAAMLTHANLASNIKQVLDDSGLAITPNDRSLGALPFFHVFGLNVVLGVTLVAGGTVVLIDPFTAAEALHLIRRHSITVVAGVPVMFDALTSAATELGDDLGSVRLAVSGAATLSAKSSTAFTQRYGVTIHEGYGLTEASPIVTSTASGGAARIGSIGPSVPGVEVRLVGLDGTDVSAGDPGEIWVRGANVFVGYWGDPEATQRVLTDGWLHTGDVAVADEDGYLSLVDRLKDLIIVSGFNVYPAEVEDVLRTHPSVVDCAVAAIPDERTGEAVGAWVVLKMGERVDLEALRRHVGSRLARYKIPSKFTFVDELPRSEAGKLLRRALTL